MRASVPDTAGTRPTWCSTQPRQRAGVDQRPGACNHISIYLYIHIYIYVYIYVYTHVYIYMYKSRETYAHGELEPGQGRFAHPPTQHSGYVVCWVVWKPVSGFHSQRAQYPSIKEYAKGEIRDPKIYIISGIFGSGPVRIYWGLLLVTSVSIWHFKEKWGFGVRAGIPVCFVAP